ncbi:MAG: xanthine dehydrogenase family protein molybdopterin-binding subunit, partial [Chloroflexi bacterium]|nr:xanthine dehydrogenase family protein molybdopterin-binding subunit [Chloroflexota bacterium]
MTMVGISESVKRREDPRLITGQGRYVDDIRLPAMANLVLVRSPHAHARIKRIDVTRAAKMPGVVAVFTAADLAGELGSLPAGWVLPDLKQPKHPPLAADKVRYVGDPVAAVVAEDAYTAADAARLVRVTYEPLPAVVDAEKATKRGAPVLHEGKAEEGGAPSNVAFDWEINGGDYQAARNKAEVVVKERIINQRLIPNAMEPRGVVAQYEAASGNLTMWTSTQIPHLVRLLFALVTGHPEHKIRVISPDVGGGFGSKLYIYA